MHPAVCNLSKVKKALPLNVVSSAGEGDGDGDGADRLAGRRTRIAVGDSSRLQNDFIIFECVMFALAVLGGRTENIQVAFGYSKKYSFYTVSFC